MNSYEEKALNELKEWQRKMTKNSSLTSRMARGLQSKVNGLIPEKAHKAITSAVKNMVKTILFGSEFITGEPLKYVSLESRETIIKEKIRFYKKAAATSGAWTGAGGLLLGLADFPILLSFKLKLLFDTASVYGFDTSDYKERLYILNIFQLAFSRHERNNEVYSQILNWESYAKGLPADINAFDWRTFQQEYRDYIDLAKMLQLVPGIGAVVGAYANYRLLDKLGETAMNAYRLRLFNSN